MGSTSNMISNRGTAVAPSTGEYASTWGVHDNYIVTLQVTDSNGASVFSVSTSVDESFSISMGATWDDPFANMLSDAMGGSKAGALAQQGLAAAGIAVRSRAQSAQQWQKSDPIEFQIPFTFIATKDPKVDVQDKVHGLLKLVAPSIGGQSWSSPMVKDILGNVTLNAPGPTMTGQMFGGIKIGLKFGNFIALDNCIVRRVDAQFDNIIGKSGIPHKAKVTVDVASYFTCFTVQDLNALFINK